MWGKVYLKGERGGFEGEAYSHDTILTGRSKQKSLFYPSAVKGNPLPLSITGVGDGSMQSNEKERREKSGGWMLYGIEF